MLEWLEENNLTISVQKDSKLKLSEDKVRSNVAVQLVGILPHTVCLLTPSNWVVNAKSADIAGGIATMMDLILGKSIVLEQVIQPENMPFKRNTLATIDVPNELDYELLIDNIEEHLC